MRDLDLETCRNFLKDSIRLAVDFSSTDQNRGVPPPPLEKPASPGAVRIDLIPPGEWRESVDVPLLAAIGDRHSHREFSAEPLSLEELSLLLWAIQGVTRRYGDRAAFRTVPSAGCRHPFETYLCILNVTSLAPGLYRYLPLEHQLLLERTDAQLAGGLMTATFGQRFTGQGAVTFVWTAIPYRTEWRYDRAAHRVILLDAGHVCQNLYLACAAIGAGTCAVAAYDQDAMDRLLGVDGVDEFTVYLAPVGKLPESDRP